MKTTRWIAASVTTVLLVGLAAALSGPGLLRAEPNKQAGQPMAMMSEQEMTKHCQEMMANRDKMMANMTAMDAELDKGVATMNSATGAARVDAVAAVITSLVSQRRAMHTQMAEMESGMMGHMMDHMSMGDMKTMQKSMAGCPMMHEMHMK